MSSQPSTTQRPYQGQSAVQRRAARKEKLLAAATQVYGTAGYRASTVKAVCDAAGLTQRYFYEAFDSQEALLCAVYARAMAQVRAALQAVWQRQQPLPERVQATVAAYFEYLYRHPQAARIVLLEVEGVSERVSAVAAQELGRLTALLRTQLLETQALCAAQKPWADLDLLSLGIVGAICQMAKAWWTQPQPPSVATMTRHATLLCLGLLHQLEQRA